MAVGVEQPVQADDIERFLESLADPGQVESLAVNHHLHADVDRLADRLRERSLDQSAQFANLAIVL